MTTKKTIKVRDLKPNKDAKGGGGHAINRAGVNHTTNSTGTNSTGANSKHASQGHHTN
jgi:hypothetical protein